MGRSIHDFPDELIHNIVSRHHDQRTLHSLCSVSKRLHAVTLPLLYRRFSHRMYTRPQRLHSFLRSILRRPELAAACVKLDIRDPERTDDFWDLESWREWAKKNYDPILETADHMAVLTAGIPLHHDAQDDMTALIQNEEGQLALLLCLLPNLRHLSLENPNTNLESPRFCHDDMVMTLLHPQIKNHAVLQKLTSLYATSSRIEGGQGGFRLSAIAPFFRLPKMDNFKGVVCYEPEDSLFVGFDCPERGSAVTTIEFHHSAICPLGLRYVIRACARLEHFACDWAGTTVGWVELNFPLMQQALYEHRSSLKTLSLDARKHFDSWPEHDDGVVPPLGSLREYTELEVLDVPASALIGWDENGFESHNLRDVLPPKVRELRINQVAPRIYEHISGMAEVCKEHYPELRRVVLCDLNDDSDASQLEADVRKRFDEMDADVEFTVSYDGGPSHFFRN